MRSWASLAGLLLSLAGHGALALVLATIWIEAPTLPPLLVDLARVEAVGAPGDGERATPAPRAPDVPPRAARRGGRGASAPGEPPSPRAVAEPLPAPTVAPLSPPPPAVADTPAPIPPTVDPRPSPPPSPMLDVPAPPATSRAAPFAASPSAVDGTAGIAPRPGPGSVGPGAVSRERGTGSLDTTARGSGSGAAGPAAGTQGTAAGGASQGQVGPDAPAGGVAPGDGALALAIPGGDAADGSAAARYRPYYDGVRREIARALRYPTAARRQGLSGTVELEVEVRPTGAVGAVAVVRSSSHRVLDDAALEAARRLPRMPFPPGLPPRTLRVRIPVDFALR